MASFSAFDQSNQAHSQSCGRNKGAVRLPGEIGRQVSQEQTIGKIKSELFRLGQSSQYDVELGLDLKVTEKLLLAHINPYFAFQIADSACLGKVIGIRPATE